MKTITTCHLARRHARGPALVYTARTSERHRASVGYVRASDEIRGLSRLEHDSIARRAAVGLRR